MIQFIHIILLPLLLSCSISAIASSRPPLSLLNRDVTGCTSQNTTAPPWSSDTQYDLSTLASYQANLYQCLQAHHSQPDWAPAEVPALWAIPTPCGTSFWHIQTMYKIGSVVTYAGLTYTCIQGHVSLPGWEPPNTPALWGPGVTKPPNTCSGDQQDCVGVACCNVGERCIDSGFQKGLCCAGASVCGNLCCLSASDHCVVEPVRGHSCCPPGNQCGVDPSDPQRPCLECFPRGDGTL